VASVRLERAVTFLVGLTVVAFASGSSSLATANHIGKTARWPVLAGLAICAGSLAWRRGVPIGRRPSVVVFLAIALCGLMALSTLWSVSPRLTIERTATVIALFVAAYLIGLVAAVAPEFARSVVLALFLGALTVVLIGYLMAVVAHADAVQAATDGIPERFRWFGENPNTVAMLSALALPLGVSSALAARSRMARAGLAVGVVLVVAAIVASESRGAALAVVGGAAAFFMFIPARAARRRHLLVWMIAPLVIAGVILFAARASAGSSGRVDVWRHTVGVIELRPVLGYGFGTEDFVFVDRFQHFAGRRPENSYLGFALQLGVAGLAIFVALVTRVLVTALGGRVRRLSLGGSAPAFAAVVVAGLLVAINQSFIYSVGNIGTATFWIAVFSLSAASVTGGADDIAS
jgi:O-antigen ligase